MKKITEEKFLKNSISILNIVSNKSTAITITRKNAGSVVIMSLKGYEAIETLLSIMDNPWNYIKILETLDIDIKNIK